MKLQQSPGFHPSICKLLRDTWGMHLCVINIYAQFECLQSSVKVCYTLSFLMLCHDSQLLERDELSFLWTYVLRVWKYSSAHTPIHQSAVRFQKITSATHLQNSRQGMKGTMGQLHCSLWHPWFFPLKMFCAYMSCLTTTGDVWWKHIYEIIFSLWSFTRNFIVQTAAKSWSNTIDWHTFA